MRHLLTFLLLLTSSLAEARDLSLIYDNNRGVALFLSDKKLEAFETFMGLTAQDPNDIHVQFNLASSMQALGEEEKALQLYKTLLENVEKLLATANEESIPALQKIRFAVLYNIGVAHQVMHKTDEALLYYQQALAIVPQSQEIKINIELMFAGGQGKGKGDNKDKKENSEGEGESDPQDQEQNQDQEQKPKDQDKKDQPQNKQPKQFDQKYMSNEDLKRIMEELKEQEQNIRAKMERKGGKSAPKDKEW